MTRRQVARFAADALASGTPSAKKLAQMLVAYLDEHGRFADVDLLVNDIRAQLQKNYGHTDMRVSSARELSAATKKQLEDLVQTMQNAKSISADYTTDPTLLGGLIASTPDTQLDLSVRGKLNRLRQGVVAGSK